MRPRTFDPTTARSGPAEFPGAGRSGRLPSSSQETSSMATVRTGNRSVLLVVDFQVDVVKDAWDAPRVTAGVARAVERARAQGVPVIWVQHEAEDMPRDSAGWQLVPELVPAAGEPRLFKKHSSSFEQTPLEQELADRGATHIVLAGAQTNWCIRAAAYAALERGYDLTLVKDAHTTADPAEIRQLAGLCLKRVDLTRRLRLLGVRVGSLSRPGAPADAPPRGAKGKAGAQAGTAKQKTVEERPDEPTLF